jgi:IS66 Orf2 like protein
VFGLGAATRIYVAVGSTDMRKGFEGLYGLVRDQLGLDPLSGHLCQWLLDCTQSAGETSPRANHAPLSSSSWQAVRFG